jgi:hypothetical protein
VAMELRVGEVIEGLARIGVGERIITLPLAWLPAGIGVDSPFTAEVSGPRGALFGV